MRRSRRLAGLLLALFLCGELGGWLWMQLRTPLPTYTLLLEGGEAADLQGPGPLVLRPETRLSLTLRPATPVLRRVFVHARIQQAQREQIWPVLFEQTDRGTLRLQGTAQELLPTCVGHCILTVYLSGSYLPPGLPSACPRALVERRLSTQRLTAEVLVTPP